jgi:hypothetical protein
MAIHDSGEEAGGEWHRSLNVIAIVTGISARRSHTY